MQTLVDSIADWSYRVRHMVDSSGLVSFLSDPATLVGLGVVAAGTAYYIASRPRRPASKIPFDSQSIELEDGMRISHLCKNGELMEYVYEDTRTLYDVFQRGKRVSGDGPCLGFKRSKDTPYEWITYAEVEKRFVAFGSGLAHIGVVPGQNSFVGIYGANCVEWVVAAESCNAYSRVVVPLYDTLGREALIHIINQAELVCVVCTANKLKALSEIASSCDNLKKIVVIGSTVSDEDRTMIADSKLELYTFEEIEKKGRDNVVDVVKPQPDYFSTICYTSGTTGLPKGVIITHKNLVADNSAIVAHLGDRLVLGPNDVHISYLPLAHMMERLVQSQIFLVGARIGFFRGDVKTLLNDIQELRPTLFLSVPRLLNRIYDKVIAGVSESKTKKWLFNRAYQSKLAEVRSGIVRNNSMWDYLVFGKVQKLLGGRVRYIVSGSAPINSRVMDFLRVALGCEVMEGYGQTEVTAGASATLPGETTTGHVGPPFACNYIKLVDVPAMNYFASNGEGEICFKGPNCTQGYFKMPEKTAELIDEDGWIHSGDVGKWLPNGTLKIIDRVKNIFKLSQGEYIAPEKVENVCARSPFVAQMFLFGDSIRSSCVAIVVPDEEMLLKWAEENERSGKTFAELCQDEDVKKMVYADLEKVCRRDGLNSLEIPKAIKLTSEVFSVDNNILTPTFKLKRPQAKEKYMQDIVQMYASLPA